MVELPKISTGAIIGGAAALGVVAGLGTAAVVSSVSKKRRKRKTTRSKSVRKRVRRNKKRKLKFGSKAYRKKYLKHGKKKRIRRTPYTAGKRKDRSHRRIRYTKKGQPYIIKGDGRARFIKKSGAKRSHRQKGGRY